MMESLTESRKYNLERVQSALRVAVKQVDMTTNKTIATEVAAKQANASVAAKISDRKAVFTTIMDYNAATGQGFDPCGELQRSKNIAMSMGEANSDMQDKVVREIDASPGQLVSDRASVLKNRIATAKNLYCTPQEAAIGLCQAAGPLAGKDVDANAFFSSSARGAPASAAKNAMLNNIYGLPYQAPSKDMVQSPEGAAFLASKRKYDAYSSVSQASLKSVQSLTESNGTADSVIDAIGKKVGVYAGGDNYDAWEQSKTSQSERGLLVEYAKMLAAELYMLNTEYQQMDRIEFTVSSWLALRTNANGDGNAADMRMRAVSTANKVK
jgi:hypothetical protein